MIFLLKAFTWTSVGLVFIWSWYILGSQAVSREYTFRTSASYRDEKLVFSNAEVASIFEQTPQEPLDSRTILSMHQQLFQAFTHWGDEQNGYWGAMVTALRLYHF